MRITIIGGTGMIGRRVAAVLRNHGHHPSIAAPGTGVDLRSGRGLGEALRGSDAVVDVSNPGYGDAEEMRRFFEEAGGRFARALREAGISRLITLSAVGTTDYDSGYFRAKAAQEAVVARSGIPFTIVRSTPFFEYIYKIVDSGGSGGDIRVPPVVMQAIAADDVARALALCALRASRDDVVEIGGPRAYPLAELAEDILGAYEDGRRLIIDRDAPYFGARIGDSSLIPMRSAWIMPTFFEDWLRQTLVPSFAFAGDGRRPLSNEIVWRP